MSLMRRPGLDHPGRPRLRRVQRSSARLPRREHREQRPSAPYRLREDFDSPQLALAEEDYAGVWRLGVVDGGYELARPAADISIADVLRCIDGPLASVRDMGLGDLPYSGPTAALTDVWRALRASMRSVLEQTSLADVAAGALPGHVRAYADDYRRQEEARGHSEG